MWYCILKRTSFAYISVNQYPNQKMSFTDQLEKMFIGENEIPAQFALANEVHQREYLCNGEMRPWEGKVHEVYSPICIKTENGLHRKLIGTYPVCTEKEAFEALDAAVAAYDNGRGQWPTMGVGDRIKCVEKFITKMHEQKDIVVKLIMWESENHTPILSKNLTGPLNIFTPPSMH